MPPVTIRRPERLCYTQDEEAQRLVAHDPVAFIIGFLLDQQVRVQVAFQAPLELQRRLGHLDPRRIAAMPVEQLVEAFTSPTPLHRYPKSMAERTHACMRMLVDRHGGDADRIWLEARGLGDLRARLEELPGFGRMKAATVSSVVARQFGLEQLFPGWDDDLPPYGSLAMCDTYADLEGYQQRKGEYKRAARAARAH